MVVSGEYKDISYLLNSYLFENIFFAKLLRTLNPVEPDPLSSLVTSLSLLDYNHPWPGGHSPVRTKYTHLHNICSYFYTNFTSEPNGDQSEMTGYEKYNLFFFFLLKTVDVSVF